MNDYKITIGIEMHCEVSKTNSKVFSSAKNGYSDTPNINVRPVDMAFPGTLPVVNKRCVEMGLMMSKILNCKQPEYLYFERKNYYYPDLPKGYQITQNTIPAPIGYDGFIDIERADGSVFKVGIDNIHLEEDSAQMTHEEKASKINYNRAGVPLLELVTTPCFHDVNDVITFLEYMRSIYQYTEISDADSKKGQVRCDVNISLSNTDELGTKVEIKNVNSFSGVRDAINYEVQRQLDLINNGEQDKIEQETRRFDDVSCTTIRMRSKVDAIDYKYFVEPNIPKIKINEEWKEKIFKSIPELPYERKNNYMTEYNLSSYDANILVKEKKIALYFEECIKLGIDAKIAANWIISTILGYISKENIEIDECFVTPSRLSVIISNLSENKISSKQAKELFNLCLERKEEPDKIINDEGMVQISDDSELIKIVDNILANSQKQIDDYHNGKTNLFGFFVGQVMKETKGKANPVKVNEILKDKLK